MPSKNLRISKTKTAEAPPAATNFRLIKGINQLNEARLHRAGIKTFEELANLQPEEILGALGTPKGITVKQIIEQDWIGQARKLSGKKPSVNGTIESEGFIVNLFLSKKKQVHSTQILHVNSDEGEKWEGWDSQRLLNFITYRSGLILPKEIKTNSPAVEPFKDSAPTTSITTIGSETTLFSQSADLVAGRAPEPLPAPPPAEPEIILRTFEMIPSHSETPSKLLRIGEPFDIHLSIDAKKVTPEFASSLDYTAAIFAKAFDAPQQFRLSEVKGILTTPDEAIVVNIPKQDFTPGTYRLEATLTVSKESQTIGHPALARTIFQVF